MMTDAHRQGSGDVRDSARRPLDRHLRYKAHKNTRLRLATDWGAWYYDTVRWGMERGEESNE